MRTGSSSIHNQERETKIATPARLRHESESSTADRAYKKQFFQGAELKKINIISDEPIRKEMNTKLLLP